MPLGRRPRRLTSVHGPELLEDRSVPAVTVVQNGTALDIQLSVTLDAVTVSGEDATGQSITVSGSGLGPTAFAGVTAISVTDITPGGGTGQRVTFTIGSGPGASFNLPGAVAVTGIEIVDVG